MSPNSNSLSSESYGPCSQFITGAGRNGDRCLTCYKKEWRHHHPSTQADSDPPPSQAAATASSDLPPRSSASTDSDNLNSHAPQTTTLASPSTVDNTVQAIIRRYAGNTGMQLRPRVKLKAAPGPIVAKREAFTGFRKNTAASSKVWYIFQTS